MVPISVMAMVNSLLNLMDCMMADKWMSVGKEQAKQAKDQAAKAVQRCEDDGKEDGTEYTAEELQQVKDDILNNVPLPGKIWS